MGGCGISNPYLGVKALRSAGSAGTRWIWGVTLPREQGDRRRVFLGALTLQLANPKALLFFLALLPQFIDPARAVVPQMLLLAGTSMVPEFCILMGYGWLAHRALHASAKFGMSSGMNALAWPGSRRGPARLRDSGFEVQSRYHLSARCASAFKCRQGEKCRHRRMRTLYERDAVLPQFRYWAASRRKQLRPRTMTTGLVHRFLQVEISPDAALVASVEGDSPPSGYYPPIRDLVIRRVRDGAAVKVAMPCGRVPQCWPGAPAWTLDGKHLSFSLRTPGRHARSVYTVAADGSGLTKLLDFSGTLDDLQYGPGWPSRDAGD